MQAQITTNKAGQGSPLAQGSSLAAVGPGRQMPAGPGAQGTTEPLSHPKTPLQQQQPQG